MLSQIILSVASINELAHNIEKNYQDSKENIKKLKIFCSDAEHKIIALAKLVMNGNSCPFNPEILKFSMTLQEILDDVLQNKIKLNVTDVDKLRKGLISINSGLIKNHARNLNDECAPLLYGLLVTTLELYESMSVPCQQAYAGIKEMCYGILTERFKTNISLDEMEKSALRLMSDKNSVLYGFVGRCITLANDWLAAGNKGKWCFWLRLAKAHYKEGSFSTEKISAEFTQRLESVENYRKTFHQKIPSLMSGLNFQLVIEKDGLRITTACNASLLKKLKNILERTSFCKLIEREASFILQPISYLSEDTLVKIVEIVKRKERKELEASMAKLEIKEPEMAFVQPVNSLIIQTDKLDSPNISSAIPKEKVKARKENVASNDSDSEEEPQSLSDAVKYGFDEGIFGTNAFIRCRQRSIENSRWFVVYGGRVAGECPPQAVEEDYIQNRMPAAKVVPATGEPGFKCGFHKNVFYLYGKNDSPWRMFPVAKQTNNKGETAFLFGEFHDTKHGWSEEKLNTIIEKMSKKK